MLCLIGGILKGSCFIMASLLWHLVKFSVVVQETLERKYSAIIEDAHRFFADVAGSDVENCF